MTVALLAADRALELLLEARARAGRSRARSSGRAPRRRRTARRRRVPAKSITTKSPRWRLAVDGLELRRALAQACRAPRRSRRRRRPARACRPRAPCTRRASAFGRTPISIENFSGSPSLGELADVDVWLADRDHARVVDRGAVPAAERLADGLVEHRLAADALDHHRRRRLAGAETGHADVARQQPSPPGSCGARPRRGRPRPRRARATRGVRWWWC